MVNGFMVKECNAIVVKFSAGVLAGNAGRFTMRVVLLRR